MGRAKKEKLAIVVQGRSLLTRLGTAHEGAKITPKILSGDEEQQDSLFYRLLKKGIIKYPKDLDKTKGQLSIDDINAEKEEKEEKEEEEEEEERDKTQQQGGMIDKAKSFMGIG